MSRTLAISSVAWSVALVAGVACTRDDAPAVQSQTAASAPSDAIQGTAQELAPERIGQEATCPVAGEAFTVTAATEALVYQGQLYLFCCPGCRGRFLGDPRQFGAPTP